jgi:uncharacterized protein
MHFAARFARERLVSYAAIQLLFGCFANQLTAAERAEANLSAGEANLAPYRCEDLTIPAGDRQLAASLYLPLSGLPVPAVVFVHGAGPAVRDDDYQELARHFARKGVAAVIYDKRGCGASTGDWTRAGLLDLAEDALSCVRLLRGRPEVNSALVGLWGLSQGASIAPIAASRSTDVGFVIAVGGCLDFENQMRYFRANVFRQHGLPPAALDIANKTFLIQVDLSNRVRSGNLPAPSWLRDTCRFEFDLDQEAIWRQVHVPILAMYGQRDKQVPVAENSAKLTAAAEQSGNRNFTLVIYPGASHAIGKTRTGEPGEEWTGYVPGYLDDMTDWILQQGGRVKRSVGRLPRASVEATDPRFSAGNYTRLGWYGNAMTQLAQFFVFAMVFLIGLCTGIARLVRARRRDQVSTARGMIWLVPQITIEGA